MAVFEKHLIEVIKANLGNSYPRNPDPYRFEKDIPVPIFKRIKAGVARVLPAFFFDPLVERPGFFRRSIFSPLGNYLSDLEQFHHQLEDQSSRDLLIDLIAYRILGHRKVKLPFDYDSYAKGIESLKEQVNEKITLPSGLELPEGFLPIKVKEDGISVLATPRHVYTTFCLPHYEYKDLVKVEPGDVVLDLGVCFADTALFFANRIGEKGHVYGMEFIPNNLKISTYNLEQNPELADRITIVENPVWEESGKRVYFSDQGPASRVSFEPFDGMEGEADTMSIDDLVDKYQLEKVDFLKMDIEGAEPFALKGAERTISQFKPKLAISIYHNLHDFTQMFRLIKTMHADYRLFLGHATAHREETTLFAI